MSRVVSREGFQSLARLDRAVIGMGLVVLAGIIWSLQGVFLRLMNGADPWQILFMRGFGMAVTTFPVLILFGKGTVLSQMKLAGWRGVAAGVFVGMSGILFVIAVTHTTVANAVFMVGAGPFFAAFLGRVILGESVRKETWIAMILSLFGILLMVMDGLEAGRLAGSIYALFSTLCFAIYSVILRSARDVDMNPTAVYKGIFEIVCAGLVIAMAWSWATSGEGDATSAYHFMSLRDVWLSLAVGLLLGLGVLVFTLGARSLTPAEMTMGSLTELVLSPIWVWLIVHERPDITTLIGGAIIVFAIILQAASGMRRARPPVVV